MVILSFLSPFPESIRVLFFQSILSHWRLTISSSHAPVFKLIKAAEKISKDLVVADTEDDKKND